MDDLLLAQIDGTRLLVSVVDYIQELHFVRSAVDPNYRKRRMVQNNLDGLL